MKVSSKVVHFKSTVHLTFILNLYLSVLEQKRTCFHLQQTKKDENDIYMEWNDQDDYKYIISVYLKWMTYIIRQVCESYLKWMWVWMSDIFVVKDIYWRKKADWNCFKVQIYKKLLELLRYNFYTFFYSPKKASSFLHKFSIQKRRQKNWPQNFLLTTDALSFPSSKSFSLKSTINWQLTNNKFKYGTRFVQKWKKYQRQKTHRNWTFLKL